MWRRRDAAGRTADPGGRDEGQSRGRRDGCRAPRPHRRAPSLALRGPGQDRRLPGRGRATRPARPLRLDRHGRPRTRGAGARRHHLAHLLDDQAHHRRRAHDPLRARAVPAQRPRLAVHSLMDASTGRRARRQRVHSARRTRAPRDGARRADAHLGPRLRGAREPRGARVAPDAACGTGADLGGAL